jgi:Type IV secretion-system coupling protein DNA-binding domain
MPITSPFLETKPAAPAMLGATIAALLTLIAGFTLLFALYPPNVVAAKGVVPLSLHALGQIASEFLVGKTCPAGITKIIGLDCRLEYLDLFYHAIAESRQASIHIITVLLAVVVSFGVTASMIYAAAPRRERFVTLRGRRLLFDADGRTSMRVAVAKTGKFIKCGLWLLPHVQLTSEAEGFNVLALGTQGSGKTSTLRGLVEQCEARGDQLFIHEVKGDFTAGLPVNRFILVAPHDRRSTAYDIARDIRNEQHAREFAVHNVPKSDHDSVWGDSARAAWADLVMTLHTANPGRWNWEDLAEVLLSPGEKIKETLDAAGKKSGSRLIFGSENPEENRTTMSVLITLWVAALTSVLPLAEAWRNVPAARRFSLQQWLARPTAYPRVIVLQKSSEYPELSAAIGGFLIDRLIGLALRPGRPRNPVRKLVFCLDELPECGSGRIQGLPRLLNTGREFGIVTLVGIQDIAHLIEIYGENLSNVILGRLRIKLVHQLDAGDSAERISNLLGQRRIEYLGPPVRDSVSRRLVRETIREMAQVCPADRLESDLGVTIKGDRKTASMLVMGLGHPAIVEAPLTVWRDRRSGHVPAAWTRA